VYCEKAVLVVDAILREKVILEGTLEEVGTALAVATT
jgi:hypothetical protein